MQGSFIYFSLEWCLLCGVSNLPRGRDELQHPDTPVRNKSTRIWTESVSSKNCILTHEGPDWGSCCLWEVSGNRELAVLKTSCRLFVVTGKIVTVADWNRERKRTARVLQHPPVVSVYSLGALVFQSAASALHYRIHPAVTLDEFPNQWSSMTHSHRYLAPRQDYT